MTDRADTLREFLAASFGERTLGDDEDIFSLGYVNSLFVMDLVLFVESTFGLTVERADLDIENFRTVRAICGFVDRKSPVRTP